MEDKCNDHVFNRCFDGTLREEKCIEPGCGIGLFGNTYIREYVAKMMAQRRDSSSKML